MSQISDLLNHQGPSSPRTRSSSTPRPSSPHKNNFSPNTRSMHMDDAPSTQLTSLASGSMQASNGDVNMDEDRSSQAHAASDAVDEALGGGSEASGSRRGSVGSEEDEHVNEDPEGDEEEEEEEAEEGAEGEGEGEGEDEEEEDEEEEDEESDGDDAASEDLEGEEGDVSLQTRKGGTG